MRQPKQLFNQPGIKGPPHPGNRRFGVKINTGLRTGVLWQCQKWLLAWGHPLRDVVLMLLIFFF